MPIQFVEELADYRAGQEGFGVQEIISSRELQSDAPAGCYVFPSADGQWDLPALAADVTDLDDGGFLTYMAASIANANGLEYEAGDYPRVLREGYVVGFTEVAVVDQDPVYVRHTADGGNTQLGALSNAAGVGLALLSNARFSRTSTTVGVALLRIR